MNHTREPGVAKTERLILMIAPHERQAVKEAAKAALMTTSDWIRDALRTAVKAKWRAV